MSWIWCIPSKAWCSMSSFWIFIWSFSKVSDTECLGILFVWGKSFWFAFLNLPGANPSEFLRSQGQRPRTAHSYGWNGCCSSLSAEADERGGIEHFIKLHRWMTNSLLVEIKAWIFWTLLLADCIVRREKNFFVFFWLWSSCRKNSVFTNFAFVGRT